MTTNPHLQYLGPATTDWNDYVGTAAADNLEVNTAHLHELAHLDPERWMIAAIDVAIDGHGSTATLYAIDQQASGVSSHADLLEIADTDGHLEVVSIDLRNELGPPTALSTLFRSARIRLVARGLRDVPLVVASRHRS